MRVREGPNPWSWVVGVCRSSRAGFGGDASRGPGDGFEEARAQLPGAERRVHGPLPLAPLVGQYAGQAGAQLACYMYNLRQDEPRIAAFLRIDDAVFRRSVTVGEELFLFAKEIKYSPRRFISQIQGVVDDQVCFEASISGMRINK